jgi:hypothetical protein
MKQTEHIKQRVTELFEYNKEDGILLRKISQPKTKVGSIAGCVTPKGYRYVQFDGRKYAVHRLIWLLEFGCFPEQTIDHIDGNKLNNKIENLRDVPVKQNCENKGVQANNKLGVRGVCYKPRIKKYVAQIQNNGKNTHLGCFDNIDSASKAYELAAQQMFTHYKR